MPSKSIKKLLSDLIPVLLLLAACIPCVHAQEAPKPAETQAAASAPADAAAGEADKGEATGAAAGATPPEGAAPPAAAAEAKPEGPSPDSLEALQEKLEQVQADIAQAKEVAAAAPVPETAAPPAEKGALTRLDMLTSIEGLLQRRITLLQRIDEAGKQLAAQVHAQEEFTANGLPEPPPYSLEKLDLQLNELEQAQAEKQTTALSLETLQTALTNAEKTRKDTEQARRKAREQLEGLKDDANRTALSNALVQATLKQSIAQQEEALAKSQLDLAKLELDIDSKRVDLLQAKYERTKARTLFSEEELQERFTSIDTRRDKLEQALTELKRTHAANDTRSVEARDAISAAKGDEEIQLRTLVSAARDAIAETSGRGVDYLEQRITNLAAERTLWERRYGVRQRQDAPELEAWLKETMSLVAELEKSRAVVEERLQNLRTSRIDIEKQIANWDKARSGKADKQSQLDALARREGYATDYLASLIDLERLANRLIGELNAELQHTTWKQEFMSFLADARGKVQGVWDYELYVFKEEDRALTAGGLVWALTVFFFIMAVGIIVRRLVRRMSTRRITLQNDLAQTLANDLVKSVARQTKMLFFPIVALYFASNSLPLTPSTDALLKKAVMLALLFQCGIWLGAALERFVTRTKLRRMQEDPSSVSAFSFMLLLGRAAIWGIAFLLAMKVLNKDVTTLMAGLGIGGIAVAFALQNILGDIFCSVAILLDRPFVVGDFIIVGEQMGTVENIGIKTTRIRSLSGEQLVLSNTDLVGSRIRNFKRMEERRAVFTVGVIYQTPKEKLERIPGMIREIIESIPKTRFDRSHFRGFGNFSLDFETVYFVLEPDYLVFMDIQQAINLRLFEVFAQEGISFAYPTQELILRRGEPMGPAN